MFMLLKLLLQTLVLPPAAGDGLLERVVYGAYLAHRTGLPMLISGFSRDTFESAQLSAPMLQAAGVRRIVLVTSAVHEWRAVHEFQSAGLTVVPAPEGFWSWPGFGLRRCWPNPATLKASTDALHEILGDLARRALLVLGVRRHTP